MRKPTYLILRCCLSVDGTLKVNMPSLFSYSKISKDIGIARYRVPQVAIGLLQQQSFTG